ncbi:MAG: tetraacyldisaccharide 4'-kinase [Leptospirillum sp.]
MKLPRPWLVPFALGYACGVFVWEAGYRWGLFSTGKLSIPVIGVGNITAGGSGKTPLVIRLAQYVLERGKCPGILSRGYGGSRSRSPMPLVFRGQESPGPEEVGDEPALMAKKLPGALFGICPDRFRGGTALQEAGADLVILDDGFQSLELFQDLKVVFLPEDSSGSFATSFLHFLPAGSLRDFPSRLAEAEILAYTADAGEEGASSRKRQIRDKLERSFGIGKNGQEILGTRLRFAEVVGADFEPAESLEDLKRKKVVLVSGIARPERFEQFLRELGICPVGHLVLKDHVSYSDEQIRKIRQWIGTIEETCEVERILTTEKDLVKWACSSRPDTRLRGISVKMDWLEQSDWTTHIDPLLEGSGR